MKLIPLLFLFTFVPFLMEAQPATSPSATPVTTKTTTTTSPSASTPFLAPPASLTNHSSMPTPTSATTPASSATSSTGASGTAASTAPKVPTIVTSDQFKLDMQIKEGIFTSNVVVNGADFKMTSRELYVYFDDKNQVKRMIAKGDVVIDQPDRHTKSGQAEYFSDDNKMILTELPQVTQTGKVVTGTVITIYRDNNKMDVDGRSRVLIYDSGLAKPSTPATTTSSSTTSSTTSSTP